MNHKEQNEKFSRPNHQLKKFCPWAKVLLYNSRLHIFQEKLKSRWSGPFNVHTVSPHSAVVIVDPKSGEEMKVNG